MEPPVSMDIRMTERVSQVRALTTQLANQGSNMRLLEAARARDMHTVVDLQGKLMAKAAETSRVRFVDVKGIGRPSVFHHEVKAWPAWPFKLGNFLEGITSGMKDGLEWCQECDARITDTSDWSCCSTLVRTACATRGGNSTPCWHSSARARPWT